MKGQLTIPKLLHPYLSLDGRLVQPENGTGWVVQREVVEC